MAPCENWFSVMGTATPPPTCVSPEPPPSDWVTRSENDTTVSLNPGVLRFARLLPTTLIAVSSAVSAESAVENEASMILSLLIDTGVRVGRWGCCGRCRSGRRERRDDLVQIGGTLRIFLERRELSELSDKRRSIGRLFGILILQLRDQ